MQQQMQIVMKEKGEQRKTVRPKSLWTGCISRNVN